MGVTLLIQPLGFSNVVAAYFTDICFTLILKFQIHNRAFLSLAHTLSPLSVLGRVDTVGTCDIVHCDNTHLLSNPFHI